MARPVVFTAIAAVAGLVFTSCGEKAGGALDLYFTADTSGRIEPCGCFTGQYGGLTRVSTVLKSEAPPGALVVEIGNAIGGPEDYHILQYRHLLRACAEMGYAAVNFGTREARLPADTLRDLASTSPVPLLGANLLDAATSKPLAAPSVLTQAGGHTVGILGVVDPRGLREGVDPSLRVDEMRDALRRELDNLKGKASLLICLAFTDEDGLERLAREFYEFDLILGGDVRQPSSALTRVNRAWIFSTTNQARALGEIHAAIDPKTGRLAASTGDIRLMVDSIPEDPAIRAHSEAYRKEVRDTPLAIDDPARQTAGRVPGVAPAATPVGSAACLACHPASHATWAKSGHAHAFDSLIARGSDADPSCLACHTVGFGEVGGYARSMRGGHLAGVGCESCHGPGSEHAAIRSAARPGEEVLIKMRPVGQGQCVQCHYGEFSRPFEWDRFWPLIQHLKEDAGKHPNIAP